jgi:putative SOS response-associated peptidase YedK
MLTTEPGADIAPSQDRQIVILQPADWQNWIYLTKPESELLRPLPGGSLDVQTVTPERGQESASGRPSQLVSGSPIAASKKLLIAFGRPSTTK